MSRSTNVLRFVTHDNIQIIINIDFFPVAFRPDSGSRPPLTGLRDHIYWTHRTQ
jgi:hypothetical protein